MANYKNPKFLATSTSADFDKLHAPGSHAPYAGIYKCHACGHEIAIAEGHVLPPQTHPQHPANLGPIQWRLAVCAVHNK
jgi:hypothetical protein